MSPTFIQVFTVVFAIGCGIVASVVVGIAGVYILERVPAALDTIAEVVKRASKPTHP